MKHTNTKARVIILALICTAATSFWVLCYTNQRIPDEYMEPQEVAEPVQEDIYMCSEIGKQDEYIQQEQPQDNGVPEDQPKNEDLPEEQPQVKEAVEDIKEIIPEIPDASQDREAWIEAKLEEYKDEIEEGDVEDFRCIIGKLDIDYVAELLNSTEAEDSEAELKAYLRSNLSEDEYQRAKQLFVMYNYILFD